MLTKKKYFTTNFIHLIHKACQILTLPISVTVSIFTVSAFIFQTLARNIPILFTVIPQHINITLIHCSGHKAFLKTPHF